MTPTADIVKSTPEVDALTLGGETFAAKAAESKAARAESKPEVVAPKVEEKETPVAKSEAPVAKGKTPLDLPSRETPKKAEPSVEDAELAKAIEELPANASPSAKSSHAILRKGYDREHARAEKMAAELAELKGKAAAPSPELEAQLKSEREARQKLEADFERVAFEHSPKFQKFIKAGDAELASAKSYVEGTEVDPSVIDAAARVTGSKRLEILENSGMSANAIAAVTPHLRELDALNRQKAEAQENWKGTQAQWESEHRAEAEKQSAAVRANEDQVFATVGKTVSEKYEPFQKVEGNDEWNASVDKRMAEARDAFDGKFPLPKTSEIIYKGLAFDVIHEAWTELRGKYNDSVAENERIKAAGPGAASTRADGVTTASTGDPMKDAVNTFNEARARRGV